MRGSIFLIDLFSFKVLKDKKSLNLRCILLKCPPLWPNTAIFEKPSCGLDYWLHPIKSHISAIETYEMYKFPQFDGSFSYIISIIHNFMNRRHAFTFI